jgi:hypothetical protein
MHCARCFFYETDVGDDTCNRCGRAYLPEANVYLGLLLMVTGGSAWALRSVLTGVADPFIRPALDLGAWATWPVSMVERPAYGLVLGAWLGLLAAAPLLAGVLYGKRGGFLLVLAEAVAGPSLAMAAVTALGVWIAAGWTLRLQSKLAGVLLGLVPIIAWWVAATVLTDFGKSEVPHPVGALDYVPAAATLKTLPPALRSLAWVPPGVAAGVAAAACLLVVGIGWADRWHVRWTAAITALLAAGPMLGLAAFVGMAEIRYGYLTEAVAGAAPEAERLQFQDFLVRYPTSTRADAVGARLAADLEQAEQEGRRNPDLRWSQDVWREVLRRHPKSPWAADAALHLGDAAVRDDLLEKAVAHYDTARLQTDDVETPAEDPLAHFSVLGDLFTIGPRLAARETAQHLLATRRDVLIHQALITDNKEGSPDARRALALYFRALGQRGAKTYRECLQTVREVDPRGPLADNVACDLAMLMPDDLRRIEALEQVIAQYPGTDGEMLAHLEAANALIVRAAAEPAAWVQAQQHLLKAEAYLARRAAFNERDPYAKALRDGVAKKLAYVNSQLRPPEPRR